MDKTEVIERIKKLIAGFMRVDKCLLDTLNENTKFVQELGMNSVDTLQLLVMLEGEFSISFDDEELNSIVASDMEHLSEFILKRIA